MNKYAVMTSLFSAIGGAIAGGTIAILVTKKHYEDYANVEIEKIRHHYALIRKDQNVVQILGNIPTDEVANGDYSGEESVPTPLADATNLINELGYRGDEGSTTEAVNPEPEAITGGSIFSKAVDESEVGEEIASPNGIPPKKKPKIVTGNEPESLTPDERVLADLGYVRISGEPYIISQEQMFNEETEWEKPTLSYYRGDDTLIDERGEVLDDTHRARYVNDRHLQMFGVLSEDENIVYVRSPQISSDFEIILEPGSYKDSMWADPNFDDERLGRQPVRRFRASD